MKKNICFIMILLTTVTSFAQIYNESNSLIRKAIVLYQKDSRGFFYKVENVDVPIVENVVSSYAYDRKSHELYVKTEYGNCVITLEDKLAKVLKHNKSVPQLGNKDLTKAISDVNNSLETEFGIFNQRRQQEIEDSITLYKARLDSIAKAKTDSIAKAKADSITKARTDSMEQIKLDESKKEYMHSRSWRWVPIKNTTLRCASCDNVVFDKDSVLCAGYKNDTLYYISREIFVLGVAYLKLHKAHITPNDMKDDSFFFHMSVFKDSLIAHEDLIEDDIQLTNEVFLLSAIDKVRSIAPYGFFEGWGWNTEYGTVTFHFKYTNTNKKTIKYIDVYWKITNDVNDIRKTGHFKGTGPLEEFDTASWNWDYSSYYVAGDASNMEITKVIITYTDGSQKVLSKNMLHFNN